MPILVNVDGLNGHGDATLVGYADGDWFDADSFSFGVDREMKQSGSKGTADINVGVSEMRECTISKAMDSASATLAQYAVNGNSAGGARIDFVQTIEGEPTVSLRYRLDRCFVKSWSTGGSAVDRPTEEVALYFDKIAFAVAGGGAAFSWNRPKQRRWNKHGLEPIPSPT